MAQAMIHPLIQTGVQPAEKLTVFDVSPAAMEQMATKYGVQTSNSIPELIHEANLVLCAVKPQNLTDDFFAECRKGQPAENAIFLTVVAGKPSSLYASKSGFSKIVRSMPNTPAMIGHGMTVWSCTPNLTSEERKKMRLILSSTGKSVRLIC